MIKIYNYSVTRNKCSIKGHSVKSLKKTLIELNGIKCYLCNKEFDRFSSLQLEHIIPVKIGGRIFCLSNLGLVCHRCHRKKTQLDLAAIQTLKKLGILMSSDCSTMPLNEMQAWYKKVFDILKENQEKKEIWFNGTIGIDYEQIIDKSNMETEGVGDDN